MTSKPNDTAIINLSPSLPEKLWGRGTDLSGYDLSIYLHAPIPTESRSLADLRLADRRPWADPIRPRNVSHTELTPGIIRTNISPIGVYYKVPIVGIYSLNHPGYFEIPATALETLCPKEHIPRTNREKITVNAKPVALSHFVEELSFWAANPCNQPTRVTFDKLREDHGTVIIRRRFDEKPFRISKALEKELYKGHPINKPLIEKLLT